MMATTAASTVSACDVKAEFDASIWAIVAERAVESKKMRGATKNMMLIYMVTGGITLNIADYAKFKRAGEER